METFVFEITDKINKLAKKLGINVGYWTQSSRGFSHIEYCGLYVGDRPRFSADTFYGVSYDRRGSTYRSEAFKELKKILKLLEELSSETYFYTALTQENRLYKWPKKMYLKGSSQ